jgi:hypothetical protein
MFKPKAVMSFEMVLIATIGLCDVGVFENLLPGTAAQLKN